MCGTGLYRLGGTFLGLSQVRRVAGESDEDREVRLQAQKVLDPGSVPLELVVSVLVTVVSFTLTFFSSHLIVTGTDPDVQWCTELSSGWSHNQYYHSLANNFYQPRTSVKLYSSSVDTPLKLLEFFYSQESGSIRSPINAEAFPLVEEVT